MDKAASTTEALLTAVFDVLDAEFGKYVVMNKYDVLPRQIPSDLDICIVQTDFERLDGVVALIAQKTKCAVVQKIWHNYRKCAYILSPIHLHEPFRLQLDFFSDFSVKSTPLLIPFEQIFANTRKVNRFLVPSYEMEFVFYMMRRIFKNDFTGDRCAYVRRIFLTAEPEIDAFAPSFFGGDYALMKRCILEGDTADFVKLRPTFWRNLKRFSRKNAKIAYAIKYRFHEFIRALSRVRHKVGISAAFLSPDGGGKSTLVKKVADLSRGAFHGIDLCYIRPRLFKNIGSYSLTGSKEEEASNPDPHGKPLNNPLKSLVRFSFYNFDYLLGTWLKITPLRVKKHLVMFDRYYQDTYVDLRRYQYRLPGWLPRACALMIPKPDLFFILDADPEVLYARKKELPLDELSRQRAEYRKLSDKLPNAHLIDASKPLIEVTEEITGIILYFKAVQTAKFMGFCVDEEGIPTGKNQK